MMKVPHLLLLSFLWLAMIVFGGVNLKAESLKVNKFEAQGIEFNFHGVLPQTKQ